MCCATGLFKAFATSYLSDLAGLAQGRSFEKRIHDRSTPCQYHENGVDVRTLAAAHLVKRVGFSSKNSSAESLDDLLHDRQSIINLFGDGCRRLLA
jgi:hypothetical protein